MPLIASFFLPFFILTVICILHDVYPFGEQCIYISICIISIARFSRS